MQHKEDYSAVSYHRTLWYQYPHLLHLARLLFVRWLLYSLLQLLPALPWKMHNSPARRSIVCFGSLSEVGAQQQHWNKSWCNKKRAASCTHNRNACGRGDPALARTRLFASTSLSLFFAVFDWSSSHWDSFRGCKHSPLSTSLWSPMQILSNFQTCISLSLQSPLVWLPLACFLRLNWCGGRLDDKIDQCR